MAFIDDREWVISHIRHCFITSDESGFCEQVLGKDEEWSRILNDRGERKGLDHLPSYAYGDADGIEGRYGIESSYGVEGGYGILGRFGI